MSTILALISTYGVPAVIVAAIIIAFFNILDKVTARKDKKVKEDTELRRQQAEVDRVNAEFKRYEDLFQKMENFIKETREGPVHTVEEQESDRRLNQFINQQLDCLVNEGADRAYYFKLHNGGKDLLGRGLLKMSIGNESIDSDCSSIMLKYQNVPRTMFPRLYEILLAQEQYDIEDVNQIKQSDPMTYHFLIEHNVSQAFFRGVKRPDGLMIGIVAMEYGNKKAQDIGKAKKNIDKKANRIVGAHFSAEEV